MARLRVARVLPLQLSAVLLQVPAHVPLHVCLLSGHESELPCVNRTFGTNHVRSVWIISCFQPCDASRSDSFHGVAGLHPVLTSMLRCTDNWNARRCVLGVKKRRHYAVSFEARRAVVPLGPSMVRLGREWRWECRWVHSHSVTWLTFGDMARAQRLACGSRPCTRVIGFVFASSVCNGNNLYRDVVRPKAGRTLRHKFHSASRTLT